MFKKVFQDYIFHHLPCDWDGTAWPVVAHILFLTFLEGSDICSLSVLMNLSQLPWLLKNNGKYLSSDIDQLPQHSWMHPTCLHPVYSQVPWMTLLQKGSLFCSSLSHWSQGLGIDEGQEVEDQVEGSIQSLSPLTILSFVTRCTAPFSSRHISSRLPLVVYISAEDLVAHHVPHMKI